MHVCMSEVHEQFLPNWLIYSGSKSCLVFFLPFLPKTQGVALCQGCLCVILPWLESPKESSPIQNSCPPPQSSDLAWQSCGLHVTIQEVSHLIISKCCKSYLPQPPLLFSLFTFHQSKANIKLGINEEDILSNCKIYIYDYGVYF